MISKIEVMIVNVKYTSPLRISSGLSGNERMTWGLPVIVKIYDDGNVGYGEARPSNPWWIETSYSVAYAIKDFYAPLLIGEEIFNLERIYEKMDSVLPGNTQARAAIDFALHDLIGKTLHVPIYKLIGGLVNEKIPIDVTIGLDEPEEMAEKSIKWIEKFNLKHIRLKLGRKNNWQLDVKCLEKVRESVGNDIKIHIDFNQAYTPRTAIEAIKRMEKYQLYLVEQPVPRDDLDGLFMVRNSVNVPVMADESAFTLQEVLKVIEKKAADVINVKVPKPGGIRNAKKIAGILEAANMQMFIGTTIETGIGAAACCHVYSSTRNIMPPGEFIFGPIFQETDLLIDKDKFKNKIRDGYIEVPNKSGLGVEVDEEELQKRTLSKWIISKERK